MNYMIAIAKWTEIYKADIWKNTWKMAQVRNDGQEKKKSSKTNRPGMKETMQTRRQNFFTTSNLLEKHVLANNSDDNNYQYVLYFT